MRSYLLIFYLSILIPPGFAVTTVLVNEGYIFERYEPHEEIPSSILNEGLSMYYEAYLHPKLHEGIPLNTLRIDTLRFHSYEEFILDMFQRDFESYRIPGQTPRIYLQARSMKDGKIIGVCAVLVYDNDNYYIDYIGVHKDFRRRKVATHLMKGLLKTIPNFNEISLDTRVFNRPAQFFYEKLGFKKLDVHPNPQKQSTYCHYVLKKPR